MFAKHPFLAVSASLAWLAVFAPCWSLLMLLAAVATWPMVEAFCVILAALGFLLFPLAGGAHALLLNIARGEDPHMRTLVRDGIRKWSTVSVEMLSRFVLCFALPALLTLVFLPNLIRAEELSIRYNTPPLPPSAYVSGMLIYLLLFSFGQAMFNKRSFAFFLAADGIEGADCCRTSAQMARQAGTGTDFAILALAMLVPVLLALGLVVVLTHANAFGVPGWIAFWVGVVFALTLCLCSVTSLYVRLKDSQGAESVQRSAA